MCDVVRFKLNIFFPVVVFIWSSLLYGEAGSPRGNGDFMLNFKMPPGFEQWELREDAMVRGDVQMERTRITSPDTKVQIVVAEMLAEVEVPLNASDLDSFTQRFFETFESEDHNPRVIEFHGQEAYQYKGERARKDGTMLKALGIYTKWGASDISIYVIARDREPFGPDVELMLESLVNSDIGLDAGTDAVVQN